MKLLLISILFMTFLLPNAFGNEEIKTLDRIQQTGKIKIGFRESEPPMSYLNNDGKPHGYSIDLCHHIVDSLSNKLGKEISVEYLPVTANNRFDALIENKIDILCGATTKTLSRSKLVDFTQLTFVTGASFMTLKGNEYDASSGQNEKKIIGVVKGTTTLETLKSTLNETLADANIITFETANEAVDALRKGEIDVYSGDQVVLIGLAMTTEIGEYVSISHQVFSYEPLALAVKRNDADFRLVADTVLSKLNRTGEINKIYNKWFGNFSEKKPPLLNILYQLNSTPE